MIRSTDERIVEILYTENWQPGFTDYILLLSNSVVRILKSVRRMAPVIYRWYANKNGKNYTERNMDHWEYFEIDCEIHFLNLF